MDEKNIFANYILALTLKINNNKIEKALIRY